MICFVDRCNFLAAEHVKGYGVSSIESILHADVHE